MITGWYFCLLLLSFFSNFNNTFVFLLQLPLSRTLYTPVLFPFLWLTVRPLAPKALVHTPQTLKRQLGLKGQMVWQSHLDLLERSHCMEKAKSETSQASSYPWAWPGGAGLQRQVRGSNSRKKRAVYWRNCSGWSSPLFPSVSQQIWGA